MKTSRDIDWVAEFDPDQRMTVRDRDELRLMFSHALRMREQEAQAAARRAALEEAAAKLDARVDVLSDPTFAPPIRTLREPARAEAIYCSELVRALLAPATPARQDMRCAACGKPFTCPDDDPRCSSCVEAGVPARQDEGGGVNGLQDRCAKAEAERDRLLARLQEMEAALRNTARRIEAKNVVGDLWLYAREDIARRIRDVLALDEADGEAVNDGQRV